MNLAFLRSLEAESYRLESAPRLGLVEEAIWRRSLAL
jgi:hypothetical protein